MAKDTALTTVSEEGGGFLAVRSDPKRVQDILKANLGPAHLGADDLLRHGVPPGGAATWTMDLGEGEEPFKTLDVILLGHREGRVYWRESYDQSGGGTRPDCFSNDLIQGNGDPGGSCAECPHAQFGSRDSGAGQACQQRKLLLVLAPHSVIPMVISLSPVNLKPIKKYLIQLGGRMLRYDQVVTRLEWKQEKSKGGYKYSEIVAKSLRPVTEEEAELVKMYQSFVGFDMERPVESAPPEENGAPESDG